jgi:hypothetical protein
MKVIYRLEARPKQAASSEPNLLPVVIPAPAPVNNVEVSWEVNAEAPARNCCAARGTRNPLPVRLCYSGDCRSTIPRQP